MDSLNSFIPKFIRYTVFLHAFCIIGILLQSSQPAVLLGRYSKNSLIILLVFVASSPLVFWLTQRIATVVEQPMFKISSAISTIVAFLCVVGAFFIWFVNTGSTNSYLLIKLYFTALLLLTFMINAQFFPEINTEWIRPVGILCIAILSIIALFISRFYPTPLWTDEGAGFSIALSWIQHGKIGIPYLLYVPYGPMYSLIHLALGAWFQIFGPSLEAARFLFLLIGFITLFFIYLTAKTLYSRWTGLLLALFASGPIITLNYLRIDMSAAFYLSVVFYLLAKAYKGNKVYLYLLAGIVLGWSLDGHPSLFRFFVALDVFFFYEYVWQIWKVRRFIWYKPALYFVLGQFIGLAFYIGFYTLLSGTEFTSIARNPPVGFSISATLVVLRDQITLPLQYAPLLTGISLLGIVIAIRKPTFFNRLLLTALIVSTLTYALINGGYYRIFYVLHTVSLYALLGGNFIFWVEEKLKTAISIDQLRLVQTGLLAIVLSASVGWLTLVLKGDIGYSSARRVANELRKEVPKSEKIVGIDPFFSVMSDYPQFIELNAAVILSMYEKSSETSAWEKIAPTSAVVIPNYPIKPTDAYMNYIHAHNFQLVKCWSAPVIGNVYLYMQSIPSGETPSDQCISLR